MKTAISTQLLACLSITTTFASPFADKGETDRLADRADAVIVGELLTGQQTGRSLSFSIAATRVIKGGVSPGALLNVVALSRVSMFRTLGGNYGVWFLRRTGAQWRLLPIMPSIAALEASGYFPTPRANSPLSLNTATPPITVSDHISVELAAAVQNYSDPRNLFKLAYGLMGINESSLIRDIYFHFRANADPEVRFVGMSRSFGSDDDVQVLGEIASNIHLIPKLHVRGLIVSSICGRSNPDPRAVGYLEVISQSSNQAIQKCSAMALMYIHTREALPALARLLDSPDPTTREYAMGGLSRFVDNLPIPTATNTANGKALVPRGPQPYRTAETDKYSLSKRWLGQANQTEFLIFWKSWWATTKDKLK